MSHIGVPQDCFDNICKEIDEGCQERTDYQFDGDNYKTIVWREGEKLMAEDDKGVREIIVVRPDELVNGTTGSLKGLFIQLLIREGFDPSVVISLLNQIRPELERLDAASRDRRNVNKREDAKRQSAQLFKALVAICKKHQEGGTVSVSSPSFSAVLPAL
jgi:hypothetical protein